MPAITTRTRGALQVLAAGFGFGFLGLFGKLAYQAQLSIGELLTYRFFLAAALLGGALAIVKPKLLRLSFRDLGVCAILGTLGYALFATLYFGAIQGLSIAVAALLLYTFPIFVTIGARLFFKESLTPKQLVALPIVLGGLALLLSGEMRVQSYTSVALGLGAALNYAIYILFSSHTQKAIHPLSSGVYVMLFAAIGLFVFHQPDLQRLPLLEGRHFAIIAGIACICTILPMVCFLSGLQKLKNAEAAILGASEPVVAAILGILFLGETLSWPQVLGGVLILTGLVLTVRTRA